VTAALKTDRRRSRRAVLAGVVSVLVLNLGMNLALDFWKPEYRDPEYGHREKGFLRELDQHEAGPVVTVLGSSRTEMGFNPGSLHLDSSLGSPLVYNVSQAGCGPVGEILNLKRLLDAGITPDFVCVEILPPVLSGNGTADKLLLPKQMSYADFGRVDAYLGDRNAFLREWVQLRVAPWFSYRQQLMNHWGGRSLFPVRFQLTFLWRDLKPFGWLPYVDVEETPEMQQKRDEGLHQARHEYLPYFPNFAIAPIPRQVYEDLIGLCQERSIRVAFYTMPESPIFRSWYPEEVRQKLDEYYDSLRARGVPVFDCSAWLDQETSFADGHHLLQDGANAFSERFSRECLGPWLRASWPEKTGYPQAARLNDNSFRRD
jgi:hypothetical protein